MDGDIDPNGVYGDQSSGPRFDCGSKAGFLQAPVAFDLARDILKHNLDVYLEELGYPPYAQTAGQLPLHLISRLGMTWKTPRGGSLPLFIECRE
ncbi:hypothetical protein [Mameliella sp. CS4]|uniref:hypothetical protein n=1 Tax=Mameliella sp. CS4 TaxID=2862329 RepID=UPI00351D8BE1